jgi:hypothetical protein
VRSRVQGLGSGNLAGRGSGGRPVCLWAVSVWCSYRLDGALHQSYALAMISIDMDHPMFPVSRVASGIADASVETVRSWLKRDDLNAAIKAVQSDYPAAARSGLLSVRRALQIAATYEIIRLGMPASKASFAAAMWTDTATMAGNKIARLPADVFAPPAITFLAIRATIEEFPDAKVITNKDLITSCSRGGAIVINLSRLRMNLFKHLGLIA